ncbi:MAG: carbamoyltransferase HypF, partial [Desulfobacterales bacterium]|nr:carbamoyltransferase HypF [Desulfobacterales bacterium]
MEQDPARRAVKISIRGIVQGVGFRPFVYQLAKKNGLSGRVCNTSGDVKIEAEGSPESIHRFLEDLRPSAPPRSQIDTMDWSDSEPSGYQTFEISKSVREEGAYQLISPDIATCLLCRKELFDPKDRRHRYPFINCTHCGPRLTIIRDIPYDRPMTTMAVFRMCPECQAEYDDPLHRRFHAQPNCCSECGPQLELADAAGVRVDAEDPIAAASSLLKEGKIIALKGIGGFLLACDATSSEAVRLLRMRKKRPFKPLAVMVPDVEEIEEICFLSESERALLTSAEAPIVLLKIRRQDLISPGVAPYLKYLGVMLPYTPLHHLLMQEVRLPLVMTSGNLSEEPIVADNREAIEKLAGIADYFLLHDREIYGCCDDSVTMVEAGKTHLIRRARGFAPDPIRLPFEAREVLGCGAGYKNTFTMTKDRYAFMSQHVGDLDNLETLSHFEKMLDLYRKLFRLNPGIVAHDKHPDYLASRVAHEITEKDKSILRVPVQHHHAHIVSCMADNGITSPVLGVAFDGTGYGDDGAIWGGEFLLADYDRFTRLAHFEYIPLPGGDAAVKKPYRMAVSYLYTLFGDEIFRRNLAFLEGLDSSEMNLLRA